ncbi:ABC transporter permease [Streptomyces sp. NPDC048650]|uniref:ABC transporter permease n=1 Tax=unclassified Streptomyces TaxID=2593676 RepID=UPI0037123796
MSTTTTPPASPANGLTESGAPRRRLLRGLPWLVYRRHRNLLIAGLLITVGGCALFAYERIGLMDFLHAHGTSRSGDTETKFQTEFAPMFERYRNLLDYLPTAVAVFLGAPLIAGEQEHGTIKLATTQSVGRTRWLAAALGLPLAAAAVSAALLALAFHWLWYPAHELALDGDWLTYAVEVTGPGLAAMTLFLTACGIGLGMLIKRVVPAMAATLFVSFGVDIIWSEKVRVHLGAFRSMIYPEHSANPPSLPAGAVEIDQWVSTADGKLYGFGTCSDRACEAKLGIVDRVSQYFDFDQMAGMQWRGAGILLALTVIVLALIVWRVRRRPL